jgi:hypothetical protein
VHSSTGSTYADLNRRIASAVVDVCTHRDNVLFPSTVNTGLPLLQSGVLQARSRCRDKTDIDSLRLGAPSSEGVRKSRRPLEGSPGEIALVDRFDAPRWTFRAEG